MSDTLHGIVRNDDPVAAFDGAAKAVHVRAKHKRIALAVYYSTLQPLSAQDVRERALRLGMVATISSAESVRRRVQDLIADHLLEVVDDRGPSGARLALTRAGVSAAREASSQLKQG